jgi:NDP-sugar pyrophosphorylase family protein
MIYKKSWKYILIKDKSYYCTDLIYYRIKAVKTFGKVKKGKFGGYIIRYHNLSQFGNCWVYNNAEVSDNAVISEDAVVKDKAYVTGNAKISGKAVLGGNYYINTGELTEGTFLH